MEELRSTEILDKEILNEARKKVENILKKTDIECENILNSVEAKVQETKTEKQGFYDTKLSVFEKDQNASIPLENERFGISFIQNAISEKLNAYLQGLSEEKRLDLVFRDFDSSKLMDKKVNAYVYGFDEKKVEKILKDKIEKNLLSCKKTEFGKIILEEDNTQLKQGIILEAQDLSFRWRLTLSQVVSKLLDEHSVELYEALFDEKVDV